MYLMHPTYVIIYIFYVSNTFSEPQNLFWIGKWEKRGKEMNCQLDIQESKPMKYI